tara:strand:+ start:56 stop:505 length:450 start_codon:yes stop_codon:yes gene_type:complete
LDFDEHEDAPKESEESKQIQEDHAGEDLEYPFEEVDGPKAAAAEGELLNISQEQNPSVPDIEVPGAIVAIANQATSSHTQILDPMTAQEAKNQIEVGRNKQEKEQSIYSNSCNVSQRSRASQQNPNAFKYETQEIFKQRKDSNLVHQTY